jgi:hypothetical protein
MLPLKKLLIAAAAALTLAPVAAFAADESGAWTVNGDFGGAIQYKIICTLKEDGTGAITGSCTDPTPGNPPSAIKGTATATAVEFNYDTTYQGSPIHLDYKGDVQADGSLKGTIDAGGPQGTFTATRG